MENMNKQIFYSFTDNERVNQNYSNIIIDDYIYKSNFTSNKKERKNTEYIIKKDKNIFDE